MHAERGVAHRARCVDSAPRVAEAISNLTVGHSLSQSNKNSNLRVGETLAHQESAYATLSIFVRGYGALPANSAHHALNSQKGYKHPRSKHGTNLYVCHNAKRNVTENNAVNPAFRAQMPSDTTDVM